MRGNLLRLALFAPRYGGHNLMCTVWCTERSCRAEGPCPGLFALGLSTAAGRLFFGHSCHSGWQPDEPFELMGRSWRIAGQPDSLTRY